MVNRFVATITRHLIFIFVAFVIVGFAIDTANRGAIIFDGVQQTIIQQKIYKSK